MPRKTKYTHITQDDVDGTYKSSFILCSHCLKRQHREMFYSSQLREWDYNRHKKRVDILCNTCASQGAVIIYKLCYTCEQVKPMGAFSKSQRKMGDYARCLTCVTTPKNNMDMGSSSSNSTNVMNNNFLLGNSNVIDSSVSFYNENDDNNKEENDDDDICGFLGRRRRDDNVAGSHIEKYKDTTRRNYNYHRDTQKDKEKFGDEPNKRYKNFSMDKDNRSPYLNGDSVKHELHSWNNAQDDDTAYSSWVAGDYTVKVSTTNSKPLNDDDNFSINSPLVKGATATSSTVDVVNVKRKRRDSIDLKNDFTSFIKGTTSSSSIKLEKKKRQTTDYGDLYPDVYEDKDENGHGGGGGIHGDDSFRWTHVHDVEALRNKPQALLMVNSRLIGRDVTKLGYVIGPNDVY